jgi:hypothetical protein
MYYIVINDKYSIYENNSNGKITHGRFKYLLINCTIFRKFFIDLLKECKYKSYFFECEQYIENNDFNFKLLECTVHYNADG